MRLFGFYNGLVYLIDSNKLQTCATYREITPAICYGEAGFTLPMDGVNLDCDVSKVPPLDDSTKLGKFRSMVAVNVSPNGDVHPIGRWSIIAREGMLMHLMQYKHGNTQFATNQWYGQFTYIVGPFVQMVNYYKPEKIDNNFLLRTRFIEESFEYYTIWTIGIAEFMKTLHEHLNGRHPLDCLSDWTRTEYNRPLVIVDHKLEDIPEFNVGEVVNWNTWYNKRTPNEPSMEEKTEKKGPKLVEDPKEKKPAA